MSKQLLKMRRRLRHLEGAMNRLTRQLVPLTKAIAHLAETQAPPLEEMEALPDCEALQRCARELLHDEEEDLPGPTHPTPDPQPPTGPGSA